MLANRLDNHYAKREWIRAVVFTTTDGSLNKAHVKYLLYLNSGGLAAAPTRPSCCARTMRAST